MSNHRSVVIPLTAAHAAAPGVIGSQPSNINTNMAPATPANGASQSFAQDHWDRYDRLKGVLKGVDDAKNALIEDVLSRYDAVMRQCQSLINEQNAREIRNKRRNDITALLNQQAEYINHLENLMNANPFIVVVVDGNNFLFNDAFIRDGEEGGRRAAVLLKDEVTEWVTKSVEQPPSDFKILIKVYADFKGLAGTYMRGGVIENLSTFGEFARGFNFNALFELVDIGGGDASSRIVDHFKLFLYDYHCHQVVFGGASQLLDNNVEHEGKITRRIALLQSTPADVKIPFKKVSFTEVFRTSKIIPSIATITPPRTGTPASLVESGSGNPPVTRSRNDSLASSTTSATAPAVPAVRTWAKLAQDVATLPQTSTVPRPVDPPARRHNHKGQRLDPPFLLDWEALKRVKQIKMCNMHYLHPAGCKWTEGKCNHRHNYEATAEEMEILKSVSRETACHNGVGCDDVVCLYGHRCPYPPAKEGSMRGLGCIMGEKCRFPREMHGIKDTTPARATNTGKH